MINEKLKLYLSENIIPKYKNLDLAHREYHVYDVINTSLEISSDYDVNLEMVYTVAVFHDVGLIKDRKIHHLIAGEMLESDSFINSYFDYNDIKIMKEAVEDHRASNVNAPRSIYGKIIAEADRSDDYIEIIRRCFLFHFDDKSYRNDFEKSFNRVVDHLEKKYGFNGYLKVWLETKKVNDMLASIRKHLEDINKFREFCLPIYNYLINEYNKQQYN